MKKTMMILLAIALVMGSVFAASETNTVNLTSTISAGNDLTGFNYPTFVTKVGDGAEVGTGTKTADFTSGKYSFSAEEASTAWVQILQNNKVNRGSKLTGFEVSLAVTQSWLGVTNGDTNTISISSLTAGTPFDAEKVTVTTSDKKFSLDYAVGIYDASGESTNNKSIGSFLISWPAKNLVVDEYNATITISYTAN